MTIFDISYVEEGKTDWKHKRIVASTVKSAIDVAGTLGVELDAITNIQNTRQMVDGVSPDCLKRSS